jgi:3-oxoacyl-[acyl-carrier protein] reductase
VSRVVLVTGAASGIGRRTAERLVGLGDRVLACDVNEVALQDLARGWSAERAAVRRLDVRDAGGWAAALDDAEARFGRLDVLLNVAGLLVPGRAHETPIEAIERQLDVNAKGVMLGTRLAGERMVRQGRGHIVNVGSLAALVPVPGLTVYSATKFAVRAFTLAAARELGPHGVAVSLLCPDLVNTPMLDAQLDYAEAALAFSGPRALEPDEVVSCLVDRLLVTREREVWLPAYRGWLARLSEVIPGLADRIYDLLSRQGRQRQLGWLGRRKPPASAAHANGAANGATHGGSGANGAVRTPAGR